MKERILYWDVIKCLAIILVVWGHCLQYFSANQDAVYHNNIIFDIIYSFHMPLFMMVSGYFALSVFHSGIIETIQKKAKQLYLPSVSAYFIVGLCLIFARQQQFLDSFRSLCLYCWSSYWFLKALFFFFVVTAFIIFIWRKSHLAAIFFIILGAFFPTSWLDFVHCVSMYPYFVVGILLHKYEKFVFANYIMIGILSFVIYLIMILNWRITEYDMYVYLFDWNGSILKIYAVRTLIGMSGSIAVIIAIRRLCIVQKYGKIIKSMAVIGTNTLGIYVFSRMIVLYGNRIIPKMLGRFFNQAYNLNNNGFLYNVLICLGATFIIIPVCVALMNGIRKNNWLKYILLGE